MNRFQRYLQVGITSSNKLKESKEDCATRDDYVKMLAPCVADMSLQILHFTLCSGKVIPEYLCSLSLTALLCLLH